MMNRNPCALAVAVGALWCAAGWAAPAHAAVDVYGRDIDNEHLEPMEESANAPAAVRAKGGGISHSFAPFVSTNPGSWPDAVAIGEVTGDGRPDVVLSTTRYSDPLNDYSVFVYAQNAGGALSAPVRTAYEQSATRNGLAIIDSDGEFANDIVVGVASGITLLRSDGSGGHAVMPLQDGIQTVAIAPMDLDGDGWDDIVATGWSDGGTQYLNNGDGTFTSSSWAALNQGWTSIAHGDLDGDGDEDIVLASGQGGTPHVRFYRNTGGVLVEFHSFQALCSGWAPRGVSIGDINGDRINDVVLSGGGNSPGSCLMLVYGQGAGLFAAMEMLPTYDIPETVRIADLDRDGLDDIVVLHGGWSRMSVYLQQPNGELGEPTRYLIPYASHYNFTHGLDVGDVNSDGCPDVVIADYNSGLVTLYGQNCAWLFGHGFE